ncbi:efflux RND transporter permease subunit [Psychroflexus sp. YR1-1]|uniref:Efflux RND transporter permease subunit n=1 Tax=Psychroflexus aurantiacus TaxID=2709310 RepID=A0A6B3R6Q1_9FLAO|nr:efflux RND transporter permease subunit [Psychroflexus aurantiacus]NEV93481.1 efflux RND transporter permease subunit [Psychroflexus aurantiacus]
MLKTFIERPVLSTVVSIILVMLGILGIQELPVTQYPDIAPPTVQVTTSFPGANAQTILESVIIPIEEQINGVEGMTYITSSASNNGSATITVFFEQQYDPDIAAVNVQNRVARANAVLPDEVLRSGVITSKQQNSALLYSALYSTNEDYSDTYVQNYLNINIKPELERINGVSNVSVFGGKDYSMRVWLDPEKMANYGLNATEVIAAIREQSQEAAPGAVGQNAGKAFEYVITYKGRLKTSEDYGNIILKTFDNNQFLRVKDVAKVELDAFSYNSLSRSSGYPGVNFGIFQTPGSNAQEIIEKIYVKMEELEENFPSGIEYLVNYDTNEFLTASISKVKKTLIEAFLLVFLVVFLFLQDFKSTLIPAIAVPVSIIGTFFFLNLFGYSINLLTLFALVLAIGIVVDDAIVVVEAVYAKLEGGAQDAKEASVSAMNEIGGAIVSITLVMAAVFIPITFIKGPAGVFYEQFGVTLIVAIIISAINALTLSPALCALFLKPPKAQKEQPGLLQRFYNAFNAGFNAIRGKYIHSLKFLVRQKWVTLLILVIAGVSIYFANELTPTGFVPTEDRGVVFMNMGLPVGSSLDRTFQATEDVYDRIQDIEGIRTASLITGRNFFSGAGSSYAQGFIILDNWEKRTTDETEIEAIVDKLNQVTASIPDAQIQFFTPPSVPGYGAADGFEVQLLDKASGPLTGLDQKAEKFVGGLFQKPSIAFANSSFSTEFPQYDMDLNVPKIKASGLTVNDVLSAMQSYVGGFFVSNFSRFGKQYRVFVQALPEDRDDEESLNSIFVRLPSGENAPVSEFVSLERAYGPQVINRFNLYNAVTINGSTAPGFSSGDAIQSIREVADEQLGSEFDIAFSGITREEIAASGQSIVIFGLSILFVYFFLAAQYESYLLPFAVIFSLPIGVAGAFWSTYLTGLQNNIYFQIALIMLVGLLAKNAILIVEFAIQRRNEGMSIYDAALDGAKVRLRPILMTSFAFILGLLPLVLATGVGAKGNNSIGTGAAGGLLVGTVIGVFVIPVLFVVFQWLQEKVSPSSRARVQNAQSNSKESE